MIIFTKLRDLVTPRPKTPEELAARAEAQHLRDEMETVRLSQRSGGGANYQSGRGTRQ